MVADRRPTPTCTTGPRLIETSTTSPAAIEAAANATWYGVVVPTGTAASLTWPLPVLSVTATVGAGRVTATPISNPSGTVGSGNAYPWMADEFSSTKTP